MKKPTPKKLRLGIESVRVLASDQLCEAIGGGRRTTGTDDPHGPTSKQKVCSGDGC